VIHADGILMLIKRGSSSIFFRVWTQHQCFVLGLIPIVSFVITFALSLSVLYINRTPRDSFTRFVYHRKPEVPSFCTNIESQHNGQLSAIIISDSPNSTQNIVQTTHSLIHSLKQSTSKSLQIHLISQSHQFNTHLRTVVTQLLHSTVDNAYEISVFQHPLPLNSDMRTFHPFAVASAWRYLSNEQSSLIKYCRAFMNSRSRSAAILVSAGAQVPLWLVSSVEKTSFETHRRDYLGGFWDKDMMGVVFWSENSVLWFDQWKQWEIWMMVRRGEWFLWPGTHLAIEREDKEWKNFDGGVFRTKWQHWILRFASEFGLRAFELEEKSPLSVTSLWNLRQQVSLPKWKLSTVDLNCKPNELIQEDSLNAPLTLLNAAFHSSIAVVVLNSGQTDDSMTFSSVCSSFSAFHEQLNHVIIATQSDSTNVDIQKLDCAVVDEEKIGRFVVNENGMIVLLQSFNAQGNDIVILDGDYITKTCEMISTLGKIAQQCTAKHCDLAFLEDSQQKRARVYGVYIRSSLLMRRKFFELSMNSYRKQHKVQTASILDKLVQMKSDISHIGNRTLPLRVSSMTYKVSHCISSANHVAYANKIRSNQWKCGN